MNEGVIKNISTLNTEVGQRSSWHDSRRNTTVQIQGLQKQILVLYRVWLDSRTRYQKKPLQPTVQPREHTSTWNWHKHRKLYQYRHTERSEAAYKPWIQKWGEQAAYLFSWRDEHWPCLEAGGVQVGASADPSPVTLRRNAPLQRLLIWERWCSSEARSSFLAVVDCRIMEIFQQESWYLCPVFLARSTPKYAVCLQHTQGRTLRTEGRLHICNSSSNEAEKCANNKNIETTKMQKNSHTLLFLAVSILVKSL